MYLAVAEKQGVAWSRLGGTMQNDMLKEFIAQKEWICPPEPAVRIVTDMIEFTSTQVPRFNPVSISGYHIREAGSSAGHERASPSRRSPPSSAARSRSTRTRLMKRGRCRPKRP